MKTFVRFVLVAAFVSLALASPVAAAEIDACKYVVVTELTRDPTPAPAHLPLPFPAT